MDLDQASELWFKFMYAELNPRKSQNGWFKITGDRICSECPRHKNRSLYVWYQKDKRPFLKCFRASCTIRRYITVEDFEDFGFDNKEAILMLLKASKVDSNIKEWQLRTKPVIVQDKSLSKTQYDYLIKRTGIQFSPALIQFYRVVPNLAQTIYDTLDESDVDDLNKFNVLGIRNDKRGITFATRDYRMFMFRSIYGNYKVKYALEKDYGYTLYNGIPDKVDTIVITEGIFDIIIIINVRILYILHHWVLSLWLSVYLIGIDNMWKQLKTLSSMQIVILQRKIISLHTMQISIRNLLVL